jgi:NADH-quinone oxidoreductase subunit L
MREFFFNLTWLIPLFPLLAFGIIILFTGKNRKLSHTISIGAMALSWVLGWGVAFSAFLTPHLNEHPIHFYTNWFPTGTTWFHIGTWIDPLSAVTLFMVPFVCLMIFIYSIGYMGYGTDEVDPNYSRFFAYISLFAAGMLGLTVSENLLTLFISWEIMGLCSYLLIGFWFAKNYPDPKKITPREAGLKAFIVTKIGDLFLLLGILYLYSQTGSLSYEVVFSQGVLHTLAEHTVALPLLGTWSVASVIGLLIFGGAVGKSAQFPLHVWLPDAMEGPTPVSALIHAATMVSAGVYLTARIFPLLHVVVEVEHHNPTMGVIAFIGAFTAFFSSTVAVAQDDIKGVLAFSTISQLGYMIAALGIGAYVAGAFHLITHAFFKALLFLGSGSVIIGCHHEQNMMEMGGLRKKMPITFWTFVAGGFALSGFPLITAGFWSKDEILAHAWHEFLHEGVVSWPFFVWLLLTIAAFLTAFYTGRQICLAFLGKPRSHHAEHAHETPSSMTVPLMLLAFFALTLGFAGIPEEIIGYGRNWFHHFVGHEFAATPLSVPVMLLSALLAVGGLFLGWLVYGRKPLAAGQPDPLVKALGPVHTVLKNKYYFDELYHATFVRGAIALSDVFFKFDNRWVIDPIINRVGRASAALASALFRFVDVPIIDGAVNLAGRVGAALSSALFRFVDIPIIDGTVNLVGRAGAALATAFFRLVDLPIIDGFVNLVGRVTAWAGRGLRQVQTGRVQNYLLVVFISVLMLLVVYLIR